MSTRALGPIVLDTLIDEPTVVLLPHDAAELRATVMDILSYLEQQRNRRRKAHLPVTQETAAIERTIHTLDMLASNEVHS